ncbi:MAG: hypothetical protein ACREYF_09225 [Gammaproteobacteria bacterium]
MTSPHAPILPEAQQEPIMQDLHLSREAVAEVDGDASLREVIPVLTMPSTPWA